jgi:hypothetical protein
VFAKLFTYSSLLVLPAWLLLLFLPAWRWTRLLAAYATPALLALGYLVLMLVHFDLRGGGFGSLDQVGRMYLSQPLLLAGWLHFLTMDVFIGAWEVRDAQRLEISHLVVAPCLVLTYLAGPIGLLAYLVIRAALVRKWPGTEPEKPQRMMQLGPRITMPRSQVPVTPRTPQAPRGAGDRVRR